MLPRDVWLLLRDVWLIEEAPGTDDEGRRDEKLDEKLAEKLALEECDSFVAASLGPLIMWFSFDDVRARASPMLLLDSPMGEGRAWPSSNSHDPDAWLERLASLDTQALERL